ncbi:hypothetical protein [Terricaulis sp.]|uniref:hypothetical protein n=1 Tax=Terricaulis sp. TaxID=2768686 RepID=UPI003784C418
MNWTLLDFVVFGAMVGVAGGVVVLAMLLSSNTFYRAGVLVAAAAAFMVVWSALAVGIIGDEQNGANYLYFAALAIAPMGAAMSGFRARGMAVAMYTTAIALVSVGLGALIFRWGADAQDTLRGIAIGSGFFPALFAGSGWLFLQAAKGGMRAT